MKAPNYIIELATKINDQEYIEYKFLREKDRPEWLKRVIKTGCSDTTSYKALSLKTIH